MQIGVRTEIRGAAARYIYTVSNRGRDTLTIIQMGWDADRHVCELTGAPPHAPPDTAYAPAGWECRPVQDKDPQTFTVDWRLADSTDQCGGILPGTSLTGLTVVLPHPDSLYEHCHWLVRFRGPVRAFCHLGKVRPESELETSSGETGTISGTITDEQGKGIRGANLFLYRAELNAFTDSNGKYTFPKVPIGAYRLAARVFGFDPCDRAHVRVVANDTTRIEFHLARASVLHFPSGESAALGSRVRSLDARGESGTIAPCPAPKLDVKSWLPVQQKRFTFSLPPDFREVKVRGIDSWVREFQSADSSVSLNFDWGLYSDPLTGPRDGLTSCEEEIGGRKARVVTTWRLGYSRGERDTLYGAGAAWRDITPGVHLTMFGSAGNQKGLEQLLGIFRTVRFEADR